MTEKTEAQTIAELAAAALDLRTLDDTPYAMIPPDYALQDLSWMLHRPRAHHGETRLERVESFVDFVAGFKTEATRLYVAERRLRGLSFTAVFDDAMPDAPSWRKHRASLTIGLDPKFMLWHEAAGKAMTSKEFAKFVEQHRDDIVEPSARDIRQIILDLRGTADVQFSEAYDESTGAKSTSYAERIKVVGGSAELEIPTSFVVALPIYERQASLIRLTCFLRLEVGEGGKIKLHFELDQIEDVVDQVLTRLANDVAAAVSLAPVYGTPPAAV